VLRSKSKDFICESTRLKIDENSLNAAQFPPRGGGAKETQAFGTPRAKAAGDRFYQDQRRIE
jgi:hypothetical protein